MVTGLMNGAPGISLGIVSKSVRQIQKALVQNTDIVHVRKRSRLLLICVVALLLHPSVALSEYRYGPKTHITAGFGVERIYYSENAPERRLSSSATTTNAIAKVEGIKRWPSVFIGGRYILPVSQGADTEEWTVDDVVVQQNRLTYRWQRADLFVGFSAWKYLHPVLGVRLSDVDQTRTDFIVNGIPVSARSEETIDSIFGMIGLLGDVSLGRKWAFEYGANYFHPLNVEVKNDALPGVEFNDTGGYSAEADVAATYTIRKRMSLHLSAFAGIVHWNGSDRKQFGSFTVKWPENDSQYLGGMLNFRWAF